MHLRWHSLRMPLLALALITLPHLMYTLILWQQVPIHEGMPVGSNDPDPWLRLVLVRDWLTSGDWYNHTVARSNAPFGGTTSPWTRPLDLVIAALVKLQPASIDLNLRLIHAALLLPVLWMALLLGGIFYLLRQLNVVPMAYLMASALVAALPATWNYFGAGNADHHAALAVLFIWGLANLFHPTPSRGRMVVCGLLFALQLWISVEAMILIGAVYGWYGLAWLRGNRVAATQLTPLATSVALGAALAVAIERPSNQWLLPIYDSISVPYVSTLFLAAGVAWLIRLGPADTFRVRLLAAMLGGAALLLGAAATYPLIVQGPLAGVDPFILTDFLPNIREAQPITHLSLPLVLAMLVQPLCALALCARAWRADRASYYSRPQAEKLLFFLIFTLILYMAQVRWVYYLTPLVAAVIAPALAVLFTPEHPHAAQRWPASRLSGLSEQQQMRQRLPILLFIMVTPIALGLLNSSYEAHFSNAQARLQSHRREACELHARQWIYSGALNHLPPMTLLAPTDLGSELLFFTPHRIIASNYHRDGKAIAYVWKADSITNTQELQHYLQQRQVEGLLLCPGLAAPQRSVLQALAGGATPPAWLKRVELPAPTTPDAQPEGEHLPNAPATLYLVNNN